MKLIYWKHSDYIYCVNLDQVQAIEIGPGITEEHVIRFKFTEGCYSYSLPKPLSEEQVDTLLRLLQACFVLDLDKVIKGLLEEEEEHKGGEGE